MDIIKKNGSKVSFNESKIKTSIENASSDIGAPLSPKEVDLVLQDVFTILKSLNKSTTSTYEIRSILEDALVKNGLKEVAKSYILHLIDSQKES